VSHVPGSDDPGFFSGDLDFGLFEETADVRHGSDGGCHEPRQSEDRTDHYQQSQHEYVQMVAVRFLWVTVFKLPKSKLVEAQELALGM